MRLWRAYWPVFVAAPILLAHMLVFNFVTDDAFISFVYSRNLARHGQLVFNLGERVEGYTNFLWTVTLAGFYKLGVRPEIASRVLGAAFAVATLALTVRMSRRMSDGVSFWNLVAPLLLAGCGGYACWASGGLETQMFTFFVTLGVLGTIEDARWSAIAFALGAMTRPEGNLIFALVVVHRLLFRPGRRIDVGWLALYLLVYGPYYAWRYLYYGWPFPNTFYIKSSGGKGTAARGAFYLWRFFHDYGPWLALPLLVPPAATALARRLWSTALVVCAGFSAYVVWVGGDFMGLYRFIVPLLPMLAVHAEQVLRRVASLWSSGRARVASAGLAAIFLFGYAVWSARVTRTASTVVRDDPPGSGIDTPAFLRRFSQDRARIGRWFGRNVQPDDMMSVGGAGAQVYYAGIRAIDAFGLNDEYVAHKVPAHGNRPGHQKWAPDSYILSRSPTILCHSYKILPEPYVPSFAETQHWRRLGWRWVSVAIPGLDPPYYNFLLRRDRSLGPIGPDLSP